MTLEAEVSDPYSMFVCAIKSPYTRDQYIMRLKYFYQFVGLSRTCAGGNMEELCRQFITTSSIQKETLILRFLLMMRGRVDRKEIVASTVRNYIKPIKLLCEMNDIDDIKWQKLT
jgi:hypothetical protein